MKPNRPQRSTVSGRFEFERTRDAPPWNEQTNATQRDATRRWWTRDISNSNSNLRATLSAPEFRTELHVEFQNGAARRLNHLLSVLACLPRLRLSLAVYLPLSRFLYRGAANGTARAVPWETMCEIPPRFPYRRPAVIAWRTLSHLPVRCSSSRTTIATQVGRSRRAAIVMWSLPIFTLYGKDSPLVPHHTVLRSSAFSLSISFSSFLAFTDTTRVPRLAIDRDRGDQAARRIRAILRSTTIERHNVALAYLELWRGRALRTRSARPSAALGRFRRPRDPVGTQAGTRPRQKGKRRSFARATFRRPNLF